MRVRAFHSWWFYVSMALISCVYQCSILVQVSCARSQQWPIQWWYERLNVFFRSRLTRCNSVEVRTAKNKTSNNNVGQPASQKWVLWIEVLVTWNNVHFIFSNDKITCNVRVWMCEKMAGRRKQKTISLLWEPLISWLLRVFVSGSFQVYTVRSLKQSADWFIFFHFSVESINL